ncbi:MULTISPECIES: carbohydrate porin [Asaia]|uniref:Porin n=1 Tax=Asaia bogorensis TaxID=91915 RepID=A0A060QJ46_9PROT|nr:MULTISPECIES: carbohydrate porin [Asaia]ETC97643.1 porin [Asaia sp. SF2.1]CDG41174.1 Porin [Asaia bogorensis]
MRGVSKLGVTLGVSIIMGHAGIARADALATLGSLSALREHGVMFHVQHTHETQAMIGSPTPRLGLEKGVGNVGIFTYGSDIDWERLAGLQGVSTHIILASGYGSPTSHKFGDFLNPSQATYGGVGNVVIHLVSVYVEKSMLYDRVSAAVGRMTFLSDFSANPLYCNFMNGAFCGNPRAASDNKAHAPFPMSNWATRVRVQISDEMAIKTGLYLTETEAIYTHHQTRTGFKFNGATIDGMALPLELSWTPAFGPRKGLSGLYKLGLVYDTARHDSRFEGMGGQNLYLVSASPRQIKGAWSAWVMADQMVWRFKGRGRDAGLTLLGAAYWNAPRTALRKAQYSLGLFMRGMIASRPSDAIGLDMTVIQVSRAARRAQLAAYAQEGHLRGHTRRPQDWGGIIEVFYQLHIWRGVSIAPDIQYYINPGLQPGLRNQLLMGVKTHIEFI